MTSNDSTIEAVTWWEYVQRVAGGETNVEIGKKVGITGPSVGRWASGKPDPEKAAQFARAYRRPVLEAFIAAGYLTAKEAGERPSATASLRTLTDRQLLAEVERRMKGGSSDARSAEAEKNEPQGLTTGLSPLPQGNDEHQP